MSILGQRTFLQVADLPIGALFILAGQLLLGAAVFSVVAGLPKWAGVLVGGVAMTGYFSAGGLLSSAGVSAVVALIAGKATAQIVSGVVAAFVSAVVSLYFIAILAAVHRQLAGPGATADNGFSF